MPTHSSPAKRSSRKRKAAPADAAVTYNEFKEFEGHKYTGMKIGRSHKWYYDQGEWKEKKLTPDLWQIAYTVTKRRAGRAPAGSGVPVGTEYHWYIAAHQNTRKLDANDYATSMTGLKFRVAHKRADSEKWSATLAAQRKRLVKFLKDVIADLEREPAPQPESAPAAPRQSPSERSVRPPRSMLKRTRRVRRRAHP